MPVISRIASMALRVAELVFAAVVIGNISSYLHQYHRNSGLPLARFIYVDIIAGLSILLALLWLLPFASGFFHWPIDLLLSFAWFAAFAILINYISNHTSCRGHTNVGLSGTNTGYSNGLGCGRWRAAESFSFLSAIFWLISALLGLWFIHRERSKRVRADGARADVAA
ncbi:hypothetical protein LTR10_024108 [Elasticomyces elasticus]|uniref:MARVEL domain-containing protein n=1 Tax=Exophiala sideris TaxID=1016849 RepID=A0ABR0JPG1_9EURO|nr:hypothetical protein LTR10_024108 [Elasticomyces elasticus]KAK5038313.1 hypothetical protein LTS07_001783 [Exophiala sideris]KAK5044297.1 hypothetical protein LTR13_000653 [Exophiala sideris]KAK5067797.1 hypothetical protein LTR69_001786 [Exophiala sideris]KAK5183963.1 hypothetical protein LTR44_003468 [Eurotiomycetes sp. CCFEE 6388]